MPSPLDMLKSHLAVANDGALRSFCTELANLIRGTQLAPDTKNGKRQRWVLENAARAVLNEEPLPFDVEAAPVPQHNAHAFADDCMEELVGRRIDARRYSDDPAMAGVIDGIRDELGISNRLREQVKELEARLAQQNAANVAMLDRARAAEGQVASYAQRAALAERENIRLNTVIETTIKNLLTKPDDGHAP